MRAPLAPDPPAVSVLIATRNNAGELAACLESIRRLEYRPDRLEIVVFDNGSTDDTERVVREGYAKMEPMGWRRLVVERSAENLGAFGGRAAAARWLDPATDFVLSLDDDVEPHPEALARLVAAAGPGVGVVGARIVYWDAPDLTASAAGHFDARLGRFRERAPDSAADCDFVSSCGCLVSRAAWQATGGFDGGFFTSHGDVDLCLRARRRGFAVRYEPAAVIRHRVARGGTRTPERVYYGYRNKLVLLRRHVPRRWRPLTWAVYAAAWAPKIVTGSVVHHRGLDLAELRAILLAVRDGALGRRGRAPWFGDG
jgi:GT2 family glycosyltransferase